MLKVLGQDIKDLQERRNFLTDNADAVVEMDYHKPYDSDELARKKTEFAEKHIRIATLEEQVKEFRDNINLELKPLRDETNALRDDIKSKGRNVREKVYQFLDEEEKMVGFYNSEGILISSRPATKDEMQKTIFADMRKDGTNN